VNLGRAIKMCRSRKGITQTELAKRSGISLAYLSVIEQNKRDPTLSVVESIARSLTVPLNILLFLAADKDELAGLTEEVREKLSRAALDLLKEPGSGFLL
jgi:transcriptional regulator with XRE-family HTH domain